MERIHEDIVAARYDYFRSLQEMAHQYTLTHLYQSMADHLFIEILFEKAHPLDPVGIKESNKFRQAILNNIELELE